MCKRKKTKQKQNGSFSESINPGYALTNCLHEKIEKDFNPSYRINHNLDRGYFASFKKRLPSTVIYPGLVK